MAVNTQSNNSLSLTLEGTQVNCQVIDLKFKPPLSGEAKLTRTACPDGIVAEPGEPQPGQLTGTVYTDTTATGLTTILLDAAEADTEVDYVLTLWNDLGNTIAWTWTGTATVSDLELTFEKPGKAKHNLSLALATAVRTRPAS